MEILVFGCTFSPTVKHFPIAYARVGFTLQSFDDSVPHVLREAAQGFLVCVCERRSSDHRGKKAGGKGLARLLILGRALVEDAYVFVVLLRRFLIGLCLLFEGCADRRMVDLSVTKRALEVGLFQFMDRCGNSPQSDRPGRNASRRRQKNADQPERAARHKQRGPRTCNDFQPVDKCRELS